MCFGDGLTGKKKTKTGSKSASAKTKTKRKKAKAEDSGKANKKKRGASASTGEEDSVLAKGLGRQVRPKLAESNAPPEIEWPSDIRADVLEKFFEGDELAPDKKINRVFRASGKGMDETFSTATTREFIKGVMEGASKSDFSDEEWTLLKDLVDIVSGARILTQYSGYALEDEVMQHPAPRAKAFFADPYDTASEHSRLNSERAAYVEKEMKAAIEAKEDATGIIVRGVRAAIEFTLNRFTAPITADNVFKHSRRSGTELRDADNLDQVESRERLKRYYVDLGGTLREPKGEETDDAALTREWERLLSVPPSPRRTGKRPNAPKKAPPKMPSLGDPDAMIADSSVAPTGFKFDAPTSDAFKFSSPPTDFVFGEI